MQPKPARPSNAQLLHVVASLAKAAGNVIIVTAPPDGLEPTREESEKLTAWIRAILDPIVTKQTTGGGCEWDDLRDAAHKLLDECCRRLKCADCGGVNDSDASFHCKKCDADLQREIPF